MLSWCSTTLKPMRASRFRFQAMPPLFGALLDQVGGDSKVCRQTHQTHSVALESALARSDHGFLKRTAPTTLVRVTEVRISARLSPTPESGLAVTRDDGEKSVLSQVPPGLRAVL